MDALLLQVVFGGLTAGSIYAMIALGFTLVYRTTTVINFAHGEFVMLGALIATSLVMGLGLPVHLPLYVAVPLAILATAAIGVLAERLVVRPMRTQPPFVLILITLGLSAVLSGAAMVRWGKDPLRLPAFSGEQSLTLGGATILPQVLWILAATVVTVGLLSLFLTRTTYGKALRACAENPSAASLVGIDVSSMIMLSFGLSAAIGGLAGVLISPITAMDFQSGFLLAMKGLTGAIIGGLDRVAGVVVGAVLLGLIESFGAAYVSSLMKDALAFVVLIVVLIWRPSGLLGRRAAR
jgi:branched-chain amino acid transport system permease protein